MIKLPSLFKNPVAAPRWVQRFTPLLADAARFYRHALGDRWFVDETHAKVNVVLALRASPVDQHRHVIDVPVSARRDANAGMPASVEHLTPTRFALDRVEYQIDVGPHSRAAFDGAVARYRQAARSVGRTNNSGRPTASRQPARTDPEQLRAPAPGGPSTGTPRTCCRPTTAVVASQLPGEEPLVTPYAPNFLVGRRGARHSGQLLILLLRVEVANRVCR